MLIFIAKTIVCLTAFFGLYKWLVANNTFYHANRLTLLFITMLTLVLSSITFPAPTADAQALPIGSLEELVLTAQPSASIVGMPPEANAATGWRITNILALIYIIGVAACLVLYFADIAKVLRIVRKTPVFRKTNEYTLLLCDDNMPSFSWHRYIVMSRYDFLSNGEEILAHELAHTRLRHSIDSTFMNLASALLWANPVMWLVRRETRLVAEYEADAAVIAQGIDAKQYQLLLIKKAVGPSRYTIANSLNHSSLKKRITMMRTKKTNPWARLRYGYVALVAAAVLPAFAHKDIVSPIEETLRDNLIEELQRSIKPTIASKGEDNLAHSQTNKQESASLRGHRALVQQGTAAATTSAIENVATNAERHAAVPDTVLAVSAATNATDSIVRYEPDKTPLIVINGQVSTYDQLRLYGTADIEAMYVIKGDAAIDAYGNEGRNGVILVTTKTTNTAPHLPEGDDVFEVVEEFPKFEGGEEGLKVFLAQNLRYPKAAHAEEREGRIIVGFIVGKDGKVYDTKVLHKNVKDSPDLEAEAVRVINLTSGKWTPGRQRGNNVNLSYALPITFRLSPKEE